MRFLSSTLWIFGILILDHFCMSPCHGESISTASSSHVVSSFKGSQLSHMIYSPVSQYLYVGAANRISQLKSDSLDEVAHLTTGPRLDHRYCGERHKEQSCLILVCQDVHKRDCRQIMTDAKVRGMTADTKYLYVCYNLNLGFCQRLELQNVARINSNSTNSVVCSDPNTTVNMLIGDHPSSRHLKALYMGATKCNSKYGFYNNLPVLSTRSLDNFELVQRNGKNTVDLQSTNSMLDIRGDMATYFKVYFIYAFTYIQQPSPGRGNPPMPFTFHLIVQPEGADVNIMETRLARICQRDKFYYSYMELTLRCTGQDEKGTPVDYNLAQSANLSRAGTELASRLGISPDDQVLYVAFSSSNHNRDRDRRSAVCVYSMAELQRTFLRIIHSCFYQEAANIGPNHYRASDACNRRYDQNSQKEIDLDFCSSDKENSPLTGAGKSQSMIKQAMLQFTGVELRSVLGGPASEKFTVVLLGTETGRLLQYELGYEEKSAVPWNRSIDNLKVGDSPIIDLVQAEEKEFVYALTPNKVAKVRLFSCEQHLTCEACQQARNPHCGWCILSARCQTKKQCTNRGNDFWLSRVRHASGVHCPRVKHLEPFGVQENTREPNTAIDLKMALENVPFALLESCRPPKCKRQCSFAFDTANEQDSKRNVFTLTSARVVENSEYSVVCSTPSLGVLPDIPKGKDHVAIRVNLVVRDRAILWSRFYIYDCYMYSSCSTCVRSKFGCNWCIRENRCVPKANARDECNQINIVGHYKDLECPRYVQIPQVIRKPSGRQFNNLRLRVLPNLKPFYKFKSTFHCVITCPGLKEPKVVDAMVNPSDQIDSTQSIITCLSFNMSYSQKIGLRRCRVNLRWTDKGITERRHRQHFMENINNSSLEVYKCEHMVSNCGECLLELSPKYRCSWCRSSGSCSLLRHCRNQDWLKREETCDGPLVNEVLPLNTTLTGSVIVTLRGINLGQKFADIKKTVVLRVARPSAKVIPCEALEADYVPGKQVRCLIKAPRFLQESEGRFEINVANRYLARSNQTFAFLKPRVVRLSRSLGPLSGGTYVCLYGSNLAIGNSRAVIWNYQNGQNYNKSVALNCLIANATNQRICCITAKAPKPGKAVLNISFDTNLVTIASATFNYEKDPEVDGISRTMSILGGGLSMTVSGFNLHVPGSVYLVFSLDERSVSSRCQCNATSMVCLTPNATSLRPTYTTKRERRQARSDFKVRYGFVMDNVASVRNRGVFFVHPNPTVTRFPGGRLVRHLGRQSAPADAMEDSLKLDGHFLRGAISVADVRVTVGSLSCAVVTLKARSLICMLARPKQAFAGAVRVQIGRSLIFELGELVYESEGGFSRQLLIVVLSGCGGLLFVLIVALVICVIRCQSKAKHRMQRKMDQMINNIEMKVANECKEAFAELQTDMSEVTHALALASNKGYTRLPYRDYTYFCMHQLFPNTEHDHHPVLGRLEIPRASYDDFDQGFRRLSELLKNRTFVVVCVRALEAQLKFSQRDRSNFASLLSAALQSKMEYFTELLKVLLKDLIANSVERKKEKLLFRRSESVAEKMLANWLTFLLYDYLKDRAGEPLYLLTQAIWLQISRGPLDAVTYESRYALSDEKLLRETVDSVEVRLILVDPCGTFDQSKGTEQAWEQPVKVLDCDTITQVKEKILFVVFRHTACSARPSANDIDLELLDKFDHHPEKIHLTPRRVMQDLDGTCEIVRNNANRTNMRNMRRYNTLRHYMRLWDFKSGAYVKCVLKSTYETYSSKIHEFASSTVNSTTNLTGAYSEHPESITGVATLPVGLGHSSSLAHFQNGYRTLEDPIQLPTFHLVKSAEDQREESSGRSSKLVSEVLLNRMLVTKNCIQRYIDDFLKTVFAVAPDSAGAHSGDMMVPLCIKYMFDFLDDQALDHNIADPEVIHIWKSNCLPLRFWVGVVKNPECLFDILKTPAVDACLSVIAQTLMESCNWSKTQLGKDSPASKLLFARDIDPYRESVVNYYKDIKSIPAISDQEMTAHLIAHSNKHANDFNGSSAFHTLYDRYICKYKNEIELALEENDEAKRQGLAQSLHEVHHYLEKLPPVRV